MKDLDCPSNDQVGYPISSQEFMIQIFNREFHTPIHLD